MRNLKVIGYLSVGVLFALFILIFCFASIKRVDSGNVGIVINYLSQGKTHVEVIPTNSYTFVNPFAGQGFVEYPTQQESLVLSSRGNEGEFSGDSTLQCFMNGGGTINIGLTVNWQVDPAHPETLYLKQPKLPLVDTINHDIASTIVFNAVKSDALAVCSQYTWQDLLGDGTGVSQLPAMTHAMLVAMQNDLAPDGILVNQVFIGERDPSAAINAIIAAKNLSEQAQYLQQQAQYQANAAVVQAQGQAKAIAILNAELARDPAYINYLIATRWDGHLPSTLVTNGNGSSANPVLVPFKQ